MDATLHLRCYFILIAVLSGVQSLPPPDEADCGNESPCNDGICTRTSEGFSCDCTGTGYTGRTCDEEPVSCPALPTVINGEWSDGDCRLAEVPLNTECLLTCSDGLVPSTAAATATCVLDGSSASGKYSPDPVPFCALPEWKRYNNAEYAISPWNNLPAPYTRDRYSFTAARQLCQAHGGDLASIADEATFTWLKENVLPVYNSGSPCVQYWFWTGLVKPVGTTCNACRIDWSWIDGCSYTAWHQTNWMGGQPIRGDRYSAMNGCHNNGYRWDGDPVGAHYRVLCRRGVN